MSNPHANGTKNLRPVTALPREQFLAASAKGGRARTQAKKDAGKISAVRQKWLAGKFLDEDLLWIQTRSVNRPDICIDLLGIVNDVLTTPNKDNEKLTREQKIVLGNFYREMARFIHGDKQKVDVNVTGSVQFIVTGVNNTFEQLNPDVVDAEFEELKEDE